MRAGLEDLEENETRLGAKVKTEQEERVGYTFDVILTSCRGSDIASKPL